MPPVARLGDEGAHGGFIVTASADVLCNGRGVARVGDIYDCFQHGPNPIVAGSRTVFANGKGVARLGDPTACGAYIGTASPDTYAGD